MLFVHVNYQSEMLRNNMMKETKNVVLDSTRFLCNHIELENVLHLLSSFHSHEISLNKEIWEYNNSIRLEFPSYLIHFNSYGSILYIVIEFSFLI